MDQLDLLDLSAHKDQEDKRDIKVIKETLVIQEELDLKALKVAKETKVKKEHQVR